ncbi:hypothetical protein ACFQ46_02070 [Kineococcus sp. GCM10028916]|uniref:hypothetical protein n=1 Tax=Kineococcus sp. GCM10028916 TaxID=3273394 RepID=UPI003640424A
MGGAVRLGVDDVALTVLQRLVDAVGDVLDARRRPGPPARPVPGLTATGRRAVLVEVVKYGRPTWMTS